MFQGNNEEKSSKQIKIYFFQIFNYITTREAFYSSVNPRVPRPSLFVLSVSAGL